MTDKTCQEVTRIVLAGEDRELDALERRSVRLHWRECEGCRHFYRHVRLTRTALNRWRWAGTDDDDSGVAA